MAKIFIIFDDAKIRQLIGEVCRQIGREVSLFQGTSDAMVKMDREPADVVLVEYRPATGYGADVVQDCRTRHPEAVVMIVSGCSEEQAAAEALRLEAGDYLALPFEFATLRRKIDLAVSRRGGDSRNRPSAFEMR